MDDFRILGERFGLKYAEAFRYIGPQPNYTENIRNYANRHAVPL